MESSALLCLSRSLSRIDIIFLELLGSHLAMIIGHQDLDGLWDCGGWL